MSINTSTDPSEVSSLLDTLPAVFQEDRQGRAPNFLGRFLLGFEHILLGREGSDTWGLEQTIARIYRYFEPGADLDPAERAPPDFLQWLAGWVALTLRDDWDELRQRDFVAKAAHLYRLRGTKRGVEEFLGIYTRLGVFIDEITDGWRLGVKSRVGVDTVLDGAAPFYFRVRILLPSPNPDQIKVQREVARAIVDLQKPAHSYYTLEVDTPDFQIGVHSTIGVDTLLGPRI